MWQFGEKDVFVGKQLEVAAKSQIGLSDIFHWVTKYHDVIIVSG